VTRGLLLSLAAAWLIVGVASALAHGLIASVDACPGQTRHRTSRTEQEAAMLCMTNFARHAAGLAPLADSNELDCSAAGRSGDILRCDSFSHLACGRDIVYWMRRTGYLPSRCWRAGANLAWGTVRSGTVRSIVRACMRSSEHRRNILGHYSQIGIGLRVGRLWGRSDSHVWTQLRLALRQARASLSERDRKPGVSRSAPQAAGDGTIPSMRRALRILSIALITAGVVLLADIAVTLLYKEPLSSVYAAIQQDKAASELSETEAQYPDRADRRAIARIRSRKRRIATLARRFGTHAEEGEAIGRIRAPAMDGLNIVVVQGTDTASLEKGPGHYPETPFPGQGGTVGIAGHRTTYLAPFRHIDSMKGGDRIVLETPYATIFYRVQKTAIVDPTDTWVVRNVGYERLVLSSCNPLYSAAQRFIVFARAVREKLAPRVRPS
jgi:sortase A